MPALPHGSTNICACKAYQGQQTAELAFDKTLRLEQTLEEGIAWWWENGSTLSLLTTGDARPGVERRCNEGDDWAVVHVILFR